MDWARGVRATLAAVFLVAGEAAGAAAQPVSSPPRPMVSGPVRQVEFAQAIEQALARNPSVERAVTAVTQAEALLQQARSATRPKVSAGLTNITLDSARGFEGGITQPQNQSAFSASANAPILAPARWAAVTQARYQIDLASRSVTEARQQVAVAAAQTYLAVIAARRQVEVDERALENARAHLSFADRRLEGGAGSRLNQLRAAQAVSGDQARLEGTLLALIRAQEALGVVLAENGPADAGAEPAFDIAGALDESVWMSARPDVQVQQSARRAAERVLNDSRKDWFPTGTASFDPLYITPSGLFQPARTWRLSFTVTQPLFDSGERRALETLRRVSFRQADLSLTLVEIQARSEVRTAHASVASLERVLERARLAAGQANEVLRITTAAFELGATTNIEVIDAQRSARDAETAAAQAEDAVRRARLDLLVAVGRFPG